MSVSTLDLERARFLAESVPDPELPPLTIGELGIVREVRSVDDAITVVVTPTYSGCPAAEFIETRIAEVLEAEGFASVEVERTFTPPWTTDWMTESGRRKLAAAGIAPPGLHSSGEQRATPVSLRRSSSATSVTSPPCPRCGSDETELISSFGSTACKALCRCRACLEPFDYFKPL